MQSESLLATELNAFAHQVFQYLANRRAAGGLGHSARWGEPPFRFCSFACHAAPRSLASRFSSLFSASPGVLKFWMGHAGEDMSDLYDKIKSDVAFRREMAEKAGLGFELPSKICVIGRNGRKIESKPVLELAASA